MLLDNLVVVYIDKPQLLLIQSSEAFNFAHLEKRQAGQVGISRDIPVQVFENGISQDNLG